MLALAAPAQAAQRPPLRLTVDPCVGLARPAVRRAMAIELPLLTDAPPGPTAPASEVTEVKVTCRERLVEIRIDDPLTKKTLSRAVDLQSAPEDGRARLLGLAIVELLEASWTELERNPQPRVPPAGPPPPGELRQAALTALQRATPPPAAQPEPPGPPLVQVTAAPRRPGPVRLMAVFSGQSYFNGLGLLAGAGLRAGGDHRYGLGWSLDVVGQHGAASFDIGTVAADAVSASAQMIYHRRLGPEFWGLTGRVGAGARAAAVHVAGRAVDAGETVEMSHWGGTFGPLGSVALSWRFSPRLVVDAMVEAGYATVTILPHVQDLPAPGARLGGTWLGFQLGLGFQL
jgi:hypothetical protein